MKLPTVWLENSPSEPGLAHSTTVAPDPLETGWSRTMKLPPITASLAVSTFPAHAQLTIHQEQTWHLLQTNTFPNPAKLHLIQPALYPSPDCTACQYAREIPIQKQPRVSSGGRRCAAQTRRLQLHWSPGRPPSSPNSAPK